MKKIRSQAALVANVEIPVLLLGESGTGKEVLARLIHKLSPRAHRTFLKVNCAAVPADLLESELFGYEAGAFTGANHAKPGKFELCNKGTILFDEIGEMPPLLQAKLLHVLQDQTFSRLGSRTMIKVDVRILAATNIDIPEALATKRLREDLYYRLNAFTMSLPPLRERKEEIPILLKHFMSRMSESLRAVAVAAFATADGGLSEHSWPGNLRELSNFIKRYLVLGDESLAARNCSPVRTAAGAHADMHGRTSAASSESAGGLKSLSRTAKDGAEAEAIARALEETNWNRKQAAALLRSATKLCFTKSGSMGSRKAGAPIGCLPGRELAEGGHAWSANPNQNIKRSVRRDHRESLFAFSRKVGADKRTRTSTTLRSLGPEPSASASSAISA